MKPTLATFSILFSMILLTAAPACERAKPEKSPDGKKTADITADMKTPEPAMQPVSPPDGPAKKPVAKQAPGEARGTFYIKLDFTVVRGLAMVQANVAKFRELSRKQGFMGRLITCGADPFTTMDRLTAVLPPKVRAHPAGAVTISGEFVPEKVISCLEAEFLKEQFTVETEGATKWLKSPRMTLQLASPEPKQVRGVTRGWDKLAFPDELDALEKRLPIGYALLVGAVGEVLPMQVGLKMMLVSFAPAGDAIELSGVLQFGNEAMATAVQNALVTGLNARKNAAAQSTDSKMQLAASMLGRIAITRTGAELGVTAKVPYTELIQSLGLFQFKVKGTF